MSTIAFLDVKEKQNWWLDTGREAASRYDPREELTSIVS